MTLQKYKEKTINTGLVFKVQSCRTEKMSICQANTVSLLSSPDSTVRRTCIGLPGTSSSELSLVHL